MEEPKQEKNYKEGVIIVMFEDDVALEDARKLVTSFGLKIYAEMAAIKIFTVAVPIGEEREWIEKFIKERMVAEATLNRIRQVR